MFVYETRLIDSSRKIADMLVEDIGNDPKKFDAMMELLKVDEYPLSMRAARVIELCTFNTPALIEAHIPAMINILSLAKVEGVRRSILKIFADLKISLNDDILGQLTDLAFGFLTDQKRSISIRAYSMDLLLGIVQVYPELKGELILILESMIQESSVGLRNKSRKVLKTLL